MKLKLYSYILIMFILSACTSTITPELISISTEEFSSILQTDSSVILLDVRTPSEFYKVHIEGALNINFYDSNFKETLSLLNKEDTYLIYCRSGARSGGALQIMAELGFIFVYDLDDGIVSWIENDLPTLDETHLLLPEWSVLENNSSSEGFLMYTSYEELLTTKYFFDKSVTWTPLDGWLELDGVFSRSYRKHDGSQILVSIQEHSLCDSKTQVVFSEI